MVSTSLQWTVAVLIIIIAGSFLQRQQKSRERLDSVVVWLDEYDLFTSSGSASNRDRFDVLAKHGINSLWDCAHLDEDKLSFLDEHDMQRTLVAVGELKNKFLLKQWLAHHNLQEYESRLHRFDCHSLSSLLYIELDVLRTLATSSYDYDRWLAALADLQQNYIESSVLTEDEWIAADDYLTWHSGAIMLLILMLASGVVAMTMTHLQALSTDAINHKTSFFELVTGKYLSPHHCRVFFDWEEPQQVGHTMTIKIKFFQRNSRPYPISDCDGVLVEIMMADYKVATSTEFGALNPSDVNTATVTFTVRKAGEYKIAIMVGAHHVRGSPFLKRFHSGSLDPSNTGFIHHYSILTVTLGQTETFSPVRQLVYDKGTRQATMVIVLREEGIFQALVTYKGAKLKHSEFNIIVLNANEAAVVKKNVDTRSHDCYYEAKMTTVGYERFTKSKKVYIYISPKQVTVKEFILRIIPMRLYTFRLCPSTKFIFHSNSDGEDDHAFTIDDGSQPPLRLTSPDCNVISATFTQFLLKNIGGSETFRDKQNFFFHEVRKLHQKKSRDKLCIRVHRDRLLESSMKACKSFSTADWCRLFELTFIGEEGLDWGGLRREWFELMCTALFDPQNQLFTRFKNDNQGLVHPNPRRQVTLKLKYYEFAGKLIGKCLYESSLGGGYRQLVKARFTRSFLAQLIGLRVHYKYFEQDDPDFYVAKIRYIEENSVEDLELYFAEEQYNDNGKLEKVIELVPGGIKIRVTNQNKLRYLNSLAQYRLATDVQQEVEYFLKGLNDLIPDNLLSIFDENELELLMCGTGNFSISEFKQHHIVNGSSYEHKKVLDWFWTLVASFTEEEMARLLQFTTGCSQLPPGGFSELIPKFQISATPAFGTLPTAHTCFNQLCLPDYNSLEDFQRALLLAINEGSEGFGMA
ncbi:PREDICTED: apoptosis-resistant E3 ubiquitin protein ligase 1-like [Priapulus caudatus]|uniref:HECT-type E3 ubiquitin transferase n=1 Tax=Priapulus caudatus TaxID=37621 RepID=A0ABM1FC58_PRICU|nr:PREDICTED: apoptosis-resistant E3 ubiquitin protein ligase 1-like [Priapulus caudatus]